MSVSLILDNVFEQMKLKRWTKFVWAEVKYFQMWWSRNGEESKEVMRGFVEEGRFEFVNGGWSSHDEGCPTF